MQGWSADVITARALAPLPRLLELAQCFLSADSVCLFLKGRSGEYELTEARVSWHMIATTFPSRVRADGNGAPAARHPTCA